MFPGESKVVFRVDKRMADALNNVKKRGEMRRGVEKIITFVTLPTLYEIYNKT